MKLRSGTLQVPVDHPTLLLTLFSWEGCPGKFLRRRSLRPTIFRRNALLFGPTPPSPTIYLRYSTVVCLYFRFDFLRVRVCVDVLLVLCELLCPQAWQMEESLTFSELSPPFVIRIDFALPNVSLHQLALASALSFCAQGFNHNTLYFITRALP